MSSRRKNNNKDPKPSLVPPLLAALASLVIPGLGQVLARTTRRGILLFLSFVSIVALVVWRIRFVARRETGVVDTLTKAYQSEPILLILSIAIVFLYIWIAYDAYLTAQRSPIRNRSAAGIWILMFVAYFAIGWQIGEISLVTLATGMEDAGPFISRVLWPWDAAFDRQEELLIGSAEIQVPCSEEPFPPSEEVEGEPYLLAIPTCGELSQQDGTPGTLIHLSGKYYAPGTETEIWWEDPIGNEFRARYEGEYVKLFTDENGEFLTDLVMPYRLLPPSAAPGVNIWVVQARQVAAVGRPEATEELRLAIVKMIETIFLGMMATFFGILFAVPISFLAARNLMSSSWITVSIYYGVRTVMNIVRAIEPLIWAVLAVVVVGLGPFAGIIALTVHTVAALGKLYSEAIESIDDGPIEAIEATGATWVQKIIFAVVPQIIPPFISFTIYRWDINVRMSTVIGLVGGGGIGFLLIQWIRLLDYEAAGIAVWLIAITVAILDYVSAEIRERYV